MKSHRETDVPHGRYDTAAEGVDGVPPTLPPTLPVLPAPIMSCGVLWAANVCAVCVCASESVFSVGVRARSLVIREGGHIPFGRQVGA